MTSRVKRHCPRKLLFAVLLLSVGLSAIANAQTAGPSRDPILRIETGMHTAGIDRLGVDAANRFLVTASIDKTVRVWELPTGLLLRVIRVPIGEANEGKLYSVAISPDGNTIAAGGWTGYEWDQAHSIYIFDRASGRLTHHLSHLPNVINHLAYSPDGRYLACTFGGKNGVRIFSTVAYAQTGADSDYGDASHGADFDRTNKLTTTSYDGFIRLYSIETDGSLRLLAKQISSGGKQPRGISFSPDGTRLAFGFRDTTTVWVLSARDLSPLFAPDIAVNVRSSPDGRGGFYTLGQMMTGNLWSVAWSTDGNTLYAGGDYAEIQSTFSANTRRFIRAWPSGGGGSPRDIPVEATNSLTHLVTLRDGGLVYSSLRPSFGIIDANGQRTFVTSVASANHLGLARGLLLSPDGMGVQFGYEQFGNSLARFSLTDRSLEITGASVTGWRAPFEESEKIRFTDRYDNRMIKLNDVRLPLGETEGLNGLAVAPDGEHALLGTNWFIRLFSSNGQESWKVSLPSPAFAVNITANSRLAVAAFGDGTIRWYRMTDGKELLAFFPHADRKRWVLWTPSGYYDASAGAEDLIGWHVNNGKDQAADFYPVGQFRSTYYRPDLISKILATADEQVALKLANEERGRRPQTATLTQMLPPVVEIASPFDNSEVSTAEVTIRYSVRMPSGEPVTNIRALVDGRPVSVSRQLDHGAPAAVRLLKLTVPDHDSEVSIIAENRFASSVPATIRLRWRGAAPNHDAFVIQPKLYVLAIGVSQYQNPSYSLKYAAKDAQDFAAAAVLQKGLLYRDVVTRVLTNEHATKDEILEGLDWIRKETTSKDVAMVFFAGHGLNDRSGAYYFLPYNTNLESLLRTGVPFTDIKNTVQSLAGKTLFFIDTCHSGNVLGGRRGLPDDLNGVINELASAESGAVVFAASTGNQSSYEDVKWNNGAFTKALVEGLTGRADYTGKGRITINMLDLYLSERVKELTGGKQTPTTAKPVNIADFPIAVRR